MKTLWKRDLETDLMPISHMYMHVHIYTHTLPNAVGGYMVYTYLITALLNPIL